MEHCAISTIGLFTIMATSGLVMERDEWVSRKAVAMKFAHSSFPSSIVGKCELILWHCGYFLVITARYLLWVLR